MKVVVEILPCNGLLSYCMVPFIVRDIDIFWDDLKLVKQNWLVQTQSIKLFRKSRSSRNSWRRLKVSKSPIRMFGDRDLELRKMNGYSQMKKLCDLVRRRNHVQGILGLTGSWRKIGQVSYEFELPRELSHVHPTSHVSMLKKVLVIYHSIFLRRR